MDSCEECGYRYASTARHAIAPTLRTLARSYSDRLSECNDDVLRAHPLPHTWSALEYSCHVRDVLAVQRERVQLALAEDQPTFAPMGRDEIVHERRYNAQQPEAVAEQIAAAADSLARAIEQLSSAGWLRTAVYPWPTRAVRTLEWVGRHTVHELLHHLVDFDRNTEQGVPESSLAAAGQEAPMASEPQTHDDDPDEGQGDESAYDGLAVDHLNSEQGAAELAEQLQAAAAEEDNEVTV